MGSTYAYDNQVTGTGEAYRAENPEPVAEEYGSPDESEVVDDYRATVAGCDVGFAIKMFTYRKTYVKLELAEVQG